MRYGLFATMLASLALSLLTACGSSTAAATPVAEKVVLTTSGSGTTTLILEAVKPDFEADVPGYALNVLPGTGTSGGVEGVVKGLLDVAAMVRPPKDEEAAQGVEYVELGHASAALYTHPSVGVTDLTMEQAVAIFSGEIGNWSQVGGADLDIILYVRNEDDSSAKAMRKHVFGDVPFDEAAQVLTSQSDMQVAVSGTPGSVGFGTWPSARAAGADVRPVALDGVAPTEPAYPIYYPVGIGYLSDRKADVQPLIDWLLSEQGQAALREFDVVIATPDQS